MNCKSKKLLAAVCFVAINLYSSAGAVVIDITPVDVDSQHYLVSMDKIEQVEDRVYSIRRDADGAAEVIFGDGVSGARLPTGDSAVVASYRYGAGGTAGKIINVYPLIEEQYPLLIPLSDFINEDKQEDVSFVIVGLSSIKFDFSRDGILVLQSQVSVVPVPATAWLFTSGLLALVVAARRKQ